MRRRRRRRTGPAGRGEGDLEVHAATPLAYMVRAAHEKLATKAVADGAKAHGMTPYQTATTYDEHKKRVAESNRLRAAAGPGR
ncbi:hypothetical protein [Streptomyces sp. RerS4]|uniref:hypothetical protein n=1 Tax=Streptomyces sp. RerS4 TaxID=2942449 RepID=UPI00201BBD30|nr:hypothetical protein [Streptomyces sp. RerS4]UQW99980.1 hypothetical protein M4D82_05085 [Streptomyces sp. RerS4]